MSTAAIHMLHEAKHAALAGLVSAGVMS